MMRKIKISHICKISNGYAFKSEKYANEGARVIRITNVQKGKIEDKDPKYYPFVELEQLETYRIYEGDILMSLTGNVGRVGRFPKELLPAFINQRVCRVMPNAETLDTNYLYHFLNSDKFENDAINNSAGAAQLNLSTRWLGDYEIPLPPLPQQQKIANILDAADELRQNDKALVAKYDELTRALFLDMFGDPVSNTKGWEKVKLETLCSKITDGTHKTPKYQDEGITFLSAKNIKNYKLNCFEPKYISTTEHTELIKRCPVSFGDILLTKSGSLGMAAMVEFEFEFSIFESLALVKYKKDKIVGKFLLYFMNTPSTQFQYNEMTKGVGVKHLHLSDIRKLIVINPPLELQNQFAERVALIEEQRALAQKSLERSEELFNSLLQKAFKGELV